MQVSMLKLFLTTFLAKLDHTIYRYHICNQMFSLKSKLSVDAPYHAQQCGSCSLKLNLKQD